MIAPDPSQLGLRQTSGATPARLDPAIGVSFPAFSLGPWFRKLFGKLFGTGLGFSVPALVALSGCPGAHAPSVGCGKDIDCKGSRVCTDGACVVAPLTGEAGEAPKHVLQPAPEERSAAKPSAGQGERWFRGGPGHAGATTAIGPTVEPRILWEVDLDAVVFATPTLVELEGELVAFVGTHGGRFVGVTVEGERAGELRFDLKLGGQVWGTAARSRPGADHTVLYVGNDEDTLFAIDPSAEDPRGAKDGPALLWRKRLGNCAQTHAPGPEGARCDVDGGPTVGPDGDLFVGADGVYRLSPEGDIRWHWPPEEVSERPKHVFSTPVLTADGKVYFGGQDGNVTALDAETGEQRWQYSVRADVDGSGVIGPEGAFFVGADDGRVHALRSDGSLRWSFVAQRDIRSSLGVGPDGSLYVSSFDGNLYSLEPSGEVAWVLPTGGIIHASPVVDADGTVFVGSQDDHLYAVSPKGEVLWALDLGADIDSSVVISDSGVLIVGSDDGVLRALK